MYGKHCEPVKFTRDCSAVAVPEGVEMTLPAGTLGTISQALGGSYTVYVRGRMFRVAGRDADALGKQPEPPPELPADATHADVERLAWEQMRACYDPEIPVNIVDLGLVYGCRVKPLGDGRREVHVQMTLTEPSCGMGEVMADDVRCRLERIPTVTAAKVELVFDPPWSPERMTPIARLETGL